MAELAHSSSGKSLDLTRPGIIEASAGTGKTYAIAEIYHTLLCGGKTYAPTQEKTTIEPAPGDNALPPRVREILVVTFTEAATAELRDRLRKKIRSALRSMPKKKSGEMLSPVEQSLQLADAEFDEAAVFTIHGFCLRVLKEFGLSSKIDELQTSLDRELTRFSVRWRARKIVEGDSRFEAISPKTITSLLKSISGNPNLRPSRRENTDSKAQALESVALEAAEEWREKRKSEKNLSYNEMLTELRDALNENPLLAKKIADRYRVAIVDEFQDTDAVQWEIFQKIFIENNRPLLCVGDPKQAIYEFRGGDINTYKKAKETILSLTRNELTLDSNWRSEPEMIDAINEIFDCDRKINATVNTKTPKNPSMLRVPGIAGTLEFSHVKFPEDKIKARGKDAVEESRKSASVVLRLTPPESSKDRGQTFCEKAVINDICTLVKERNVPAGNIAVLISKNKDADAYRFGLAKMGIPVSTTARGNVFAQPIAQSLADILRAMLSPQNAAAFRRALLSPFFTESDRSEILMSGEGDALSERYRQDFSEAHELWISRGFLPAFRKLSATLNFSENIALCDNPATLSTNILHLTELAQADASQASLSPRALVESFEKHIADASLPGYEPPEAFQLRSDSDSSAVRIYTVFKSKGLEFDYVFIPSLWNSSVTGAKKIDFIKGVENKESVLFFANGESDDAFSEAAIEVETGKAARTFYVALTRARKRVVLYHTPQLAATRGSSSAWESYQKLLLAAAGLIGNGTTDDSVKTPHWRVIDADESLPEDIFPVADAPANTCPAGTLLISEEHAQARFDTADLALGKILAEREGFFSFSSIIKASESLEESDFREDDETLEDDRAHSGISEKKLPEKNETSFPKKSFSDLPAGAEFGTLAHFIFEKTQFETCTNLDALLDKTLPGLKNAPAQGSHDYSVLHKKFAAMVQENLALPLTDRNITLQSVSPDNEIREMEFYFPLKRSRNLYTDLFKIFTRWGGIYAETARFHWSSVDGNKLNVAGMMNGVIDLTFKADGRYYILDWKTNRVAENNTPPDFRLSEAAIREEIVKHGYALQWTIYTLALRRFLKQSLGENYVHDRDFGGIVYLFVRWCAPFCDTGTLTDERLEELEAVLPEAPHS